MRASAAIFAAVLFAQSLGLSAPCMCDVATQPSAASAEASDHSCCHGGDSGATDDAGDERAAGVAGTIERSCGDGCQCDASLSPAVLPKFSVAQATQLACGVAVLAPPRLEAPRWRAPVAPHGSPPIAPPIAAARRLARLQIWRC